MILAAIAGYFNAKMDYIEHNGLHNDSDKKWKLKDGKRIPLLKKPWYYLCFRKPEFVEAKPFSSTLLVAFTGEKWHLYKFIMINSLFLSSSLGLLIIGLEWYYALLHFVLFRSVFGIVFTIKYK